MEYGLRLTSSKIYSSGHLVLILVVMEYGLRPISSLCPLVCCLNPCCNGIWSQTSPMMTWLSSTEVLILVVMEYGLRPMMPLTPVSTQRGLNPCCNGNFVQVRWAEPSSLELCHDAAKILERNMVSDSRLTASLLSHRLNPCCNGIWSQT